MRSHEIRLIPGLLPEVKLRRTANHGASSQRSTTYHTTRSLRGRAFPKISALYSIWKCKNSSRVTWARSTLDRFCARHSRLFPVADRPRLRTFGHCLQTAPLSGETLRWSAAGADRRAQRLGRPAQSTMVGLSPARTAAQNTDASRSATAQRCTDRGRQASPVSPACDVCVAGSALPSVLSARVQRCRLTPYDIREYVFIRFKRSP